MELFKLLIADDEENIRNGIKCILDWETLGYKICGEASNGKDAVNQIINLQPDLVILDIKMPGLTGIEVISQVKAFCEQNKKIFPSFLILSGYSEFEYAQKTINLGAKAFLLKPVDEDELQERVLQIAREIHESHKIAENFLQTDRRVDGNEVKSALVKLIHNEPVDLDLFYNLRFFEDWESSLYMCAVIYLDYVKETNQEQFYKSLDNYFSFFTYSMLKMENKLLFFFKTQNEQAVRNCLERAAKFGKSTCITVGNIYKGKEGILKTYKEALELEKYLFFYSHKTYLSKDNLNESKSQLDEAKINDVISDFMFCIETYDKIKLDHIFSQLDEMLFGVNNTPEEIKKHFIYIFIELRNALAAKYPARDFSDPKTSEIVQTILDTKNYQEIFTFFKHIISNQLEGFNFNTSDSVIVKVIAYVKSNYSHDLKLENLGEMFNCNSAYLGKKFKKYTGQQFNVYLDNLRIEEAKSKIINTDLKIYQISKLVGYSNTDYFFMKFKKNTGLTPKEFKAKMTNSEISESDELD